MQSLTFDTYSMLQCKLPRRSYIVFSNNFDLTVVSSFKRYHFSLFLIRQVGRQADRQADRQTDGKAGRQTLQADGKINRKQFTLLKYKDCFHCRRDSNQHPLLLSMDDWRVVAHLEVRADLPHMTASV